MNTENDTKTVRCRLNSIEDVCAELAKTYRETRSGRLPSAELGRLSNCLAILARIKADHDLEARILKLESGAVK